jgi:hypothetical protein
MLAGAPARNDCRCSVVVIRNVAAAFKDWRML